MKINKVLEEFREELYQLFLKRRDAVMNLLDALCSSGHVSTSVVQLSKSDSFDRQYSSITDAITNGLPEVNFDQIAKLIYNSAAKVGKKKPYRFVLDCTPNPRRYSKKLQDRHITYCPNQAPGNKSICVGHQYSVLTMLPEDQSELNKRWLIPIATQRVSSDEKGNEVGMRQITQNIDTLQLKNDLCVSIGDSLYGTEQCRMEATKNDNLVHIFRIANNRNVYTQPVVQTNTRGRKKSFGTKMNLGKVDRHLPHDYEEKFQWVNSKGKEYTVRIRLWSDMLLRGSRKYDASKHPMNLVQVQMLDEEGNDVYKRPLWLCVLGARRHEISVIDAYAHYKSRYNIEHLFRFGKQKLMLTAYQTPEVEHEELWWQLFIIAYAQLYLAKDIVSSSPEPWERYLPEYKNNSNSSTKAVSPSQVQRNFSDILQAIGTPARLSVARGRNSGRMLGDKQSHRPSSDIIFKSTASVKKKLSNIIVDSENVGNISNPKKITLIIEQVRKLLKSANITPENFSNLLLNST